MVRHLKRRFATSKDQGDTTGSAGAFTQRRPKFGDFAQPLAAY
jgi:hypothetical protein